MNENESHSQQASDADGDIYQAGRDININLPAQLAIPWIKRPSGPMFRLSPGVHEGELLCQFQVDGSPAPGGVEARWVGAGTEHDWTTPILENTRAGASFRAYQLKPVSMGPIESPDEVAFEVRFYLEDGVHHARWQWPLVQHEKGFWRLESHEGSGVQQPREEDID